MPKKDEFNTRVTYSADRKITDNEFGSFSFMASVSRDLDVYDTVKTGLESVEKEVEAILTKKIAAFRSETLPYDDRSKFGRDYIDPELG